MKDRYVVMLVDDEPMIVRLGKINLERMGYTVQTYLDSIQALSHFTDNYEKIDLVITDQLMPLMTGAEMAIQMLRIRPDLPIIMCTGYNEQVNEEEAQAIGIQRYLTKPVVYNDLGRAIEELLHSTEK